MDNALSNCYYIYLFGFKFMINIVLRFDKSDYKQDKVTLWFSIKCNPSCTDGANHLFLTIAKSRVPTEELRGIIVGTLVTVISCHLVTSIDMI